MANVHWTRLIVHQKPSDRGVVGVLYRARIFFKTIRRRDVAENNKLLVFTRVFSTNPANGFDLTYKIEVFSEIPFPS